MTTRELVTLLERAQELGGPIDSLEELASGLWHVAALGSDRMTLLADRDPPPTTQGILIHAFTLNAEKRGWEPDYAQYGERWAAHYHLGKRGHWRHSTVKGTGGNLLEAVLRAWIAAREREAKPKPPPAAPPASTP